MKPTPKQSSDTRNKNRTANGKFKKGMSGNPGGRPKKGKTIVDDFRTNPKSYEVINKIFELANTLGSDDQHPDAMACTKLVVERLVPSLKASELRVDVDGDKGFVFLPEPKPSDKEIN